MYNSDFKVPSSIRNNSRTSSEVHGLVYLPETLGPKHNFTRKPKTHTFKKIEYKIISREIYTKYGSLVEGT